MKYIAKAITNVALIVLTGWVLYLTGSAWAFVILLLMFAFDVDKDD